MEKLLLEPYHSNAPYCLYVDGFKTAGPTEQMEATWRELRGDSDGQGGFTRLDLSEPTALDQYLGCRHIYHDETVGVNQQTPTETSFLVGHPPGSPHTNPRPPSPVVSDPR